MCAPKNTMLDTYAKGLQYRIAARALMDGETRVRRGAESAECPRRGCGETEDLIHIFYSCQTADGVWRWAARVLKRLIGVEICDVELPRGAAPLRVVIRFDGASRREQGESRGPGGAGVIVHDARTEEVLYVGTRHLPNTTNNEAEWFACLMGLTAAVRLGAFAAEIGGDSTLVLNQLSGEAKVKDERLKRIWAQSDAALSQLNEASFRHLYRRFNTSADGLANHAADGYTTERYMRAPAARDEGEAESPVGSTRPDIGTCLIGVRRHCKKATVASHAGTDWFHHIRLSVLQHLWQTRNECWVKDQHSTEMDICKRVAKDIVSRLLVESSTGKVPMAAALVLRPGATFETARPRDFQDLSQW
jgi:ribonuclease HI